MRELSCERLFFVDETGSNITFSRPTAWGMRGERVVSQRPARKGANVTVIAALSLDGVVADHAFEGALKGESFEAWVGDHLVQHLSPGDIVFFDNLSVHKRASALAMIEAVGAEARFLPPYSPDMNPIELAWSKLKAHLRGAAARTVDALRDAIASAFEAITPDDAMAWFAHAGWHHVD